MVSWYAHEEPQEVVGGFHNKHIHKDFLAKIKPCKTKIW